MKSKGTFTKKDVFVVLGCLIFLLANLGAVGSSGRRRAKEAVCLSNLHKWGMAWHMFLNDNEGLKGYDGWYGNLWPYYKDEKLLICPEAARPTAPLRLGTSQLGGKFNAWAAWWDKGEIDWEEVPPPGKHYIGSYGINMWFSSNTPAGGEEEMLWGYYPGSLLAAKGAEHVPILLDSAYDCQAPTTKDTPPDYDGQIYYHIGSNVNEIRSFCLNRHHGAVNGVFLDFSARKIGLKELWTLEWHRVWEEEIREIGLPPEWEDPDHWMYNFKDYSIY